MTDKISFEIGVRYDGENSTSTVSSSPLLDDDLSRGANDISKEHKILDDQNVFINGDIPFIEVDFTQDGKTVYTLTPDSDEDTCEDFNYLESRLYGNKLLVVIRNSRQGGIFVIDIANKKQITCSQLAESTYVSLIEGGFIFLDLWDYGIVDAYDVETGKTYILYESCNSALNGLVGPLIDWMDEDSDFYWVGWHEIASKNGKIKDGHLIWTDDIYLYKHDLANNILNVSDIESKTYTMETIFGQSEEWVDEILNQNKITKSTDLVNRINSIILIHNAKLLIPIDNDVVCSPKFFKWSTMTDEDILKKSLISDELIKSPNRFNIVRDLVKTYSLNR